MLSNFIPITLVFKFSKIIGIFLFLDFAAKTYASDVLLDVGRWQFKEKYGLFSIKHKITDRCRDPRSVVGVITYRDCPYVVIRSENKIRVLENYRQLDMGEELEFKIILRVPKKKTEIFYGDKVAIVFAETFSFDHYVRI